MAVVSMSTEWDWKEEARIERLILERRPDRQTGFYTVPFTPENEDDDQHWWQQQDEDLQRQEEEGHAESK